MFGTHCVVFGTRVRGEFALVMAAQKRVAALTKDLPKVSAQLATANWSRRDAKGHRWSQWLRKLILLRLWDCVGI